MERREITLLSRETIDKIAAGEVVERPVSVVKELVENAIDSGAKHITIEIKDGGTTYIRVTDDGMGIAFDQIPTAFLRHSTSKIRTDKDLFSIRTLGFRGEALSSISAVSRVEVYTKTPEAFVGGHYVIDGGREVTYEEVGAPDGTSIIVYDLFYNVPARKKFLKTAQTEGGYVYDMAEHLALSHTEIAFNVLINGKERLHTIGNGSIEDCVYQIFGKETRKALIPFGFESEGFKVSGFLGEPLLNRGTRVYENFFVNGRYVEGDILKKACEEGYNGFLMQHQYPFLLLFFDFQEGQIDVNVHPSKLNIRIENSRFVAAEITAKVHEALSHREDISEVKVDSEQTEKREPEGRSYFAEPFERKRLSEIREMVREDIRKDSPYERKYEPPAKEIPESEPYREPAADHSHERNVEQLTFLEETNKPEYKIIGQVFGTYWIIEFDSKMYIIDQHAAHEKVLFEKTMESIRKKTMTSQLINPPIIMSLTNQEQSLLSEYASDFEKVGFSFEDFGGHEIKITAIPGNMLNLSPKDLFINILSSLKDIRVNEDSDLVLERVASMSCKAAVKGHDILSVREAEALIDELMTLENPYHCPHGRPTIISMSKYELDKKFKRIV
ncbi:MAG: DNA mismatch repair endonuclease MutL [Lachnospiraceae bacterium]|nr:DNA mismatch repair endonuclease MutL [Lachnospiraceae bacterium]